MRLYLYGYYRLVKMVNQCILLMKILSASNVRHRAWFDVIVLVVSSSFVQIKHCQIILLTLE